VELRRNITNFIGVFSIFFFLIHWFLLLYDHYVEPIRVAFTFRTHIDVEDGRLVRRVWSVKYRVIPNDSHGQHSLVILILVFRSRGDRGRGDFVSVHGCLMNACNHPVVLEGFVRLSLEHLDLPSEIWGVLVVDQERLA